MHAEEGHRVVDDTGVEHVLGPLIAAGKQGSVHRVRERSNLAIKLLARAEDLDQVRRVRRLPLDGLGLAVPTALVTAGGVGYVMPLAGDMEPVRKKYLPFEFSGANSIEWWSETGGLRRRLGILAQAAGTLAALHGRGLLYVDLHPDNIMVSDDVDRFDTWLIDTDNLTSRSDPVWTIRGAYRYCAPERFVEDSPPSPGADSHAFAVHAFRMLTSRHPLEGRQVDGLPRDDAWAKMDSGALPYVAHPKDASNRLPERAFGSALLQLMLTPHMRDLFEQAFVVGLGHPSRRPTVARWRDVLLDALDMVVDCPACGWSYYATATQCPNCPTPVAMPLLLTISSVDHSHAPRTALVLDRQRPTHLLGRHLWGSHSELEPVATLTALGADVMLRPAEGVTVTTQDGATVTALRPPAIGETATFRVEAVGNPSRIVSLQAVAVG
jgi:serine/threonine protein kinase